MGGISLKREKLEDEFEVESKLYQNEGDVEMGEMCFSLEKKNVLFIIFLKTCSCTAIKAVCSF